MAGWSRLQNNVVHHPKFAALSYRARWLWVSALCYCGEYLTDGAITREQLLALDRAGDPKGDSTDTAGRQHGHSNQHSNGTATIESLVSGGLLERTAVGYQMHDYLDWQRSRERVLRELEHDRQRKQFRGGIPPESGRIPPGSPPIPAVTVRHGIQDKDSALPRTSTRKRGPRPGITDESGRYYPSPDELDQRAGIPLHPPDSPPAPTEPPDPPFDAPLW